MGRGRRKQDQETAEARDLGFLAWNLQGKAYDPDEIDSLYRDMINTTGPLGVCLLQDVHRSVAESAAFAQHETYGVERRGNCALNNEKHTGRR